MEESQALAPSYASGSNQPTDRLHDRLLKSIILDNLSGNFTFYSIGELLVFQRKITCNRNEFGLDELESSYEVISTLLQLPL